MKLNKQGLTMTIELGQNKKVKINKGEVFNLKHFIFINGMTKMNINDIASDIRTAASKDNENQLVKFGNTDLYAICPTEDKISIAVEETFFGQTVGKKGAMLDSVKAAYNYDNINLVTSTNGTAIKLVK